MLPREPTNRWTAEFAKTSAVNLGSPPTGCVVSEFTSRLKAFCAVSLAVPLPKHFRRIQAAEIPNGREAVVEHCSRARLRAMTQAHFALDRQVDDSGRISSTTALYTNVAELRRHKRPILSKAGLLAVCTIKASGKGTPATVPIYTYTAYRPDSAGERLFTEHLRLGSVFCKTESLFSEKRREKKTGRASTGRHTAKCATRDVRQNNSGCGMR